MHISRQNAIPGLGLG